MWLVITWLFLLGALTIVVAAGTALPSVARSWWKLVIVLAGFVAVQILLINATAWGVDRSLPFLAFVIAAVAYPTGLLVLGGIGFASRNMSGAHRMLLCLVLTPPVYLTATAAGIWVRCGSGANCLQNYSEFL